MGFDFSRPSDGMGFDFSRTHELPKVKVLHFTDIGDVSCCEKCGKSKEYDQVHPCGKCNQCCRGRPYRDQPRPCHGKAIKARPVRGTPLPMSHPMAFGIIVYVDPAGVARSWL